MRHAEARRLAKQKRTLFREATALHILKLKRPGAHVAMQLQLEPGAQWSLNSRLARHLVLRCLYRFLCSIIVTKV